MKPLRGVTHLGSISIDDGVGARSGAGAGSRHGSGHCRSRCCLTMKTFYCKDIRP